MLRFRFALALLLSLSSGVALAQTTTPNLIAVTFTSDEIAEAGKSAVYRGSIDVEATGVTAATIRFPNEVNSTSLPKGSNGHFTWTRTFTSATQLQNTMREAAYFLRLDAAAEIRIDYERIDLDRPEITSPDGEGFDSILNTLFTFSPCTDCDDDTDAIVALLRNSNAVELDSEELEIDDESWVPLNGNSLPQGSRLRFAVVYVTERTSTEGIVDQFQLHFDQSALAEVAFRTGYPGLDVELPEEISLDIDSDSAPLLDLSAVINETVNGVDMSYALTVSPSGKIKSEGEADLDGDMLSDTDVKVRGTLKGKDAVLKLSTKLTLKERDKTKPRTNFTIARKLEGDAPGADLVGTEKIRGKLEDVKLKIDGVAAPVVIDESNGAWSVALDLATEDGLHMLVSNATLEVATGEIFDLKGSGTYDFENDEMTLKLRALEKEDAGLKVDLLDLTFDDAGVVTGGRIKAKVFGQTVEVDLPLAP